MLEKDKLGPRQHDQPLATMYLVGLLIERQISDLQDGPCVRVHPPGNNTEPGSQNVERKRLGEVIVGAHVEPANNIRNRSRAVSISIGDRIPLDRSRRATARPSSPGSIMSRTIASRGRFCPFSKPLRPSWATSTECPSLARPRRSSSAILASSSTTRIRIVLTFALSAC